MSLASLKKKRGANLKKLQEKLEQSSGAPKDARLWKPKFNADKGKGSYTVRFLPTKDGDPFIEQLSYSFTGPGGNFYGLARQGIGEDDPVQIASINTFRKAKADGDAGLKEHAKKWLPKRKYYANVYVIKDGEVAENEGKVFIWQFGPAVYKFIKEAIQPEFDDQKAIDPFDLWEGSDFNIRLVGTEIPDSRTGNMIKVPNYDKCSFATSPSEFMDGDEEVLEKIIDSTYDLTEFNDPSKVDSFEKVAERFKVVTGKPYNSLTQEGIDESVAEEENKIEMQNNQDNSSPVKEPDEPKEKEVELDTSDEEDEDPVAKFKRLARQS